MADVNVVNPWMLTFNSKEIDFLNPKPENITLEDIATALSRKARFNGHTKGRIDQIYTVAQHSCLVHDFIAEEFPYVRSLRLGALLHDATEAYLPDVHTRLKDVVPGFRDLEAGFENAIFDRYGLGAEDKLTIKRVDRRMLATERRDLMPFSETPWGTIDDVEPYRMKLSIWPIETAYQEFLFRYGECMRLKP